MRKDRKFAPKPAVILVLAIIALNLQPVLPALALDWEDARPIAPTVISSGDRVGVAWFKGQQPTVRWFDEKGSALSQEIKIDIDHIPDPLSCRNTLTQSASNSDFTIWAACDTNDDTWLGVSKFDENRSRPSWSASHRIPGLHVSLRTAAIDENGAGIVVSGAVHLSLVNLSGGGRLDSVWDADSMYVAPFGAGILKDNGRMAYATENEGTIWITLSNRSYLSPAAAFFSIEPNGTINQVGSAVISGLFATAHFGNRLNIHWYGADRECEEVGIKSFNGSVMVADYPLPCIVPSGLLELEDGKIAIQGPVGGLESFLVFDSADGAAGPIHTFRPTFGSPVGDVNSQRDSRGNWYLTWATAYLKRSDSIEKYGEVYLASISSTGELRWGPILVDSDVPPELKNPLSSVSAQFAIAITGAVVAAAAILLFLMRREKRRRTRESSPASPQVASSSHG